MQTRANKKWEELALQAPEKPEDVEMESSSSSSSGSESDSEKNASDMSDVDESGSEDETSPSSPSSKLSLVEDRLEIEKAIREKRQSHRCIQLNNMWWIQPLNTWGWYLPGKRKKEGEGYKKTYALSNIRKRIERTSLRGKFTISVSGNFGFIKVLGSSGPRVQNPDTVLGIYGKRSPEEIKEFREKYPIPESLHAEAKEAYDIVIGGAKPKREKRKAKASPMEIDSEKAGKAEVKSNNSSSAVLESEALKKIPNELSPPAAQKPAEAGHSVVKDSKEEKQITAKRKENPVSASETQQESPLKKLKSGKALPKAKPVAKAKAKAPIPRLVCAPFTFFSFPNPKDPVHEENDEKVQSEWRRMEKEKMAAEKKMDAALVEGLAPLAWEMVGSQVVKNFSTQAKAKLVVEHYNQLFAQYSKLEPFPFVLQFSVQEGTTRITLGADSSNVGKNDLSRALGKFHAAVTALEAEFKKGLLAHEWKTEKNNFVFRLMPADRQKTPEKMQIKIKLALDFFDRHYHYVAAQLGPQKIRFSPLPGEGLLFRVREKSRIITHPKVVKQFLNQFCEESRRVKTNENRVAPRR